MSPSKHKDNNSLIADWPKIVDEIPLTLDKCTIDQVDHSLLRFCLLALHVKYQVFAQKTSALHRPSNAQPAQERHVTVDMTYEHLRPQCTLLHLETLNVTTPIRVISPELKIG